MRTLTVQRLVALAAWDVARPKRYGGGEGEVEEEDTRPTSNLDEAPPPAVIGGRYELRMLLGAGGMSTVHLAYDLRLERLVALKLLAHEFRHCPDLGERFHREAVMLASLESRYIVPVYDVDTGEQPYLVMKYVEGRTLSQELREHTRMDPVRAVHTVEEVLRGLLVMHSRRLLHRDLKPSNIMRQPDGQIVLVDLGVARDGRRQALTRPGMILGTPAYMPPEQACDGGIVDERSDIYQVGWILAHLLCGSERKPTEEDLTRLPTVLGEVVRTATGEIDQRYRSTQEMIEALRKSR